MIRVETIREQCQRATMDVADIAPEGIGRWDRAWDITADADAEFCRALTAWEASGAPADQTRVRMASRRFLESWRYAVRQYERHEAGDEHGPVRIIDGGDRCRLAFSVPPKEIQTGIQLDPARVASITEETTAVAMVLKKVFDREGEEINPPSQIDEERGNGPAGLDKQHTALLALLLGQPRWTASELDQAAEELGLLGSGAVEVINEEAFEACGEPLLEGRDPIEINGYAVNEWRHHDNE